MMLEISKEIFGTEDYESVLEVLAPSVPWCVNLINELKN